MSEAALPKSLEIFAEVEDPRRDHPTTQHKLLDIIGIVIMGTLCGATNWVEIEMWAKTKEAWLREVLELPNGVPSHDTFGRVFSLLDAEQMTEVFTRWTQALAGGLSGVVALDGKTVRRSMGSGDGRGPIHVVSAFSVANQIVLSQMKVAEKSNEIIALPQLIRLLTLSGCTVTVDAMGCQVEVARAVREQGGDYLLRLKENQPGLFEDVDQLFGWALAEDLPEDQKLSFVSDEQTSGGHGRVEVRRCYGIEDLEGLSSLQRWPDARSVFMVEAEREVIGGKRSVDTRYYISSLPAATAADAKAANDAARQHWGIENQVHWVLDVAMDEDHNRARIGHAGLNLTLVRKLALNLLKLDKSSKGGVKARMKKAGWDNDYLLHLLCLA